ncbi:hypothetical protein STAS_19797 [Striga asiatica]|uniref:Prolamin-like domain-containing protein n=1 Tax=Striga asiatica TaxID=4170 RepID=A0A5A7QD49_STRAF|nr:hypothetical protein STAS_19797 [Striga asiatica]
MNSTLKLLPIALLLCLSLSNLATARIFDPAPKTQRTGLVARLNKLEEAEEPSTCFESLFQLQSCTSEIVLFFLNGETYLGPGCCRAVRTIQKDCWPNLLGSLGYTTEEGDILAGYCDAGEDGSSAVRAPPSPPLAH